MENTNSNLQRYQTYEKIINRMSIQMAQDFQRKQKTREHQKAQLKKTGIIDTKSLSSYKFRDDIFLKREIANKGNNYGFILLFDMSGSMTPQYLALTQQIILMAKFFRRIKVPFQVYGFSSGISRPMSGGSDCCLLRLLSSEGSRSDFNENCYYTYAMARTAVNDVLGGLYYLGGTPMVQSLHKILDPVHSFIESNNTDICHFVILTDGAPSDTLSRKGTKDDIILTHRNRSYFLNKEMIKSELLQSGFEPGYNTIEMYGLLGVFKEVLGNRIKLHHFDLQPRFDEVEIEEPKNKFNFHTITKIPTHLFSNCFEQNYKLIEDFETPRIHKSKNPKITRSFMVNDYMNLVHDLQPLKMLCNKIVDLLSEID